MRKIHSLLMLSSAILILQVGLGWAGPQRSVELGWEGPSRQQASKLWIWNLSVHPAEAALEAVSADGAVAKTEMVSVGAGKAVEVPAARPGEARQLRLRGTADLFVLEALDNFDTALTEIEGPPKAARRSRAAEGAPLQVLRPDWARNLLAGGPTLSAGNKGLANLTSDDPDAQVEVAVELLEPGSSVRLRLVDGRGEERTALVASSSKPVRWRTFLGDVEGEAWVEIKVLRGEAFATAAAVRPGIKPLERKAFVPPVPPPGGSGFFNHEINWWHTSDLYYSVAGAPPNMSGTSWVLRNNGNWVPTAGWIHTDNNGNATKGPWSYANQPGDEDAWAYIQWANGLETNWSHHIWDKTPPSTGITCTSGLPAPTSFCGSSYDGPYGAGFDARWADCKVSYYNRTTGLYWTPTVGWYGANANYELPCTIYGMPSRSVSWDAPQVPPGPVHTPGHCYRWKACLYDGGLWGCWDLYFCA